MNKSNVAAGIVLYLPDYNRLLKCVENLSTQVSKIIIHDNSPSRLSDDDIYILEQKYNCEYVFHGYNIGLPKALNNIFSIAKNYGYDWVLSLDGDSIVPSNMMEEYSKYFDNNDIGIICPQVIDKRRKYQEVKHSGNEYVDMCITSAACVRVLAWEDTGKYDEILFIDLLDNDFCKRIRLKGWKIYKVNNVVLDHMFGEIYPKSNVIVKFWITVSKILRNENFAKFSYKKVVNPERIYYTCRNVVYLNKKYENYGGIGYSNYGCKTFFGFIISFIIPSVLR